MFNDIITREYDPATFANSPEQLAKLIDDALRSKDTTRISAALRTAALAKAQSRQTSNTDNLHVSTLDERMRPMACLGMRLHLSGTNDIAA